MRLDVLYRPFSPLEVEFVPAGYGFAVYPPGHLVTAVLDEATDGAWVMERAPLAISTYERVGRAQGEVISVRSIHAAVTLTLGDGIVRVGDDSADCDDASQYGDRVKAATTGALRNAALRAGVGRHLHPDCCAAAWIAWARTLDLSESETRLDLEHRLQEWIEFVARGGPFEGRRGEREHGFDQRYQHAFAKQMRMLFPVLERMGVEVPQLQDVADMLRGSSGGDQGSDRPPARPRTAPSTGGQAANRATYEGDGLPKAAPAKYAGTCAGCHQRIEPGDTSYYDRTERRIYCSPECWPGGGQEAPAQRQAAAAPAGDEYQADDDDPFAERRSE